MDNHPKNLIDKTIFGVAATVTFLLALVSILFTDTVVEVFSAIFGFFTNTLGSSFIVFALFVIVACLYIAFSKYGNLRLGLDTDRPEFDNISWFSMIFAAGMGIGLVFWSVAEPLNHFMAAPFADPMTPEAAVDSLRYTFLHWGVHPWALYAAVALPMGYFHYRKGLPLLISSSFTPFFERKNKMMPKAFSKGIDAFTVILVLVGVATSFGLGALQIQSGLSFVFGVPATTLVAVAIVIVCTTLFLISSTAGIERGMKMMSNSNTAIVFAVMFFVLFTGPTKFIINLTLQSAGEYIFRFIPMSFFTDAVGTVAEHAGFNWTGGWTIFYWAWWITWTPFVGSFIARISKGRTLREFILAILGVPTIMSFIWFGIMGGTALNISLADSTALLVDGAVDTNSSVFLMLSKLPLSGIVSTLIMLSLTVFFLTSADAGVQVVSTMSSGGVENSSKVIKIVWGVILGLLAIMFVVTGGLSAVQSLSFAFSFPYLFVITAMLIGMFIAIRKEKV
ncbi:MAG: BCCT family transporter [Eubacteriaceae bacterium]|nr:BCCT family transporter [Eubacteriaceae bacterium]